jgi:hypothetical protein
MNGQHDFAHSEHLMRARRNRFLVHAASWLAALGFLYGLGALVCKVIAR